MMSKTLNNPTDLDSEWCCGVSSKEREKSLAGRELTAGGGDTFSPAALATWRKGSDWGKRGSG